MAEPGGLCAVHGNADECLNWRLNQVRLALAVAIVRNRPSNRQQTLRQFVQSLQANLRNQVSRQRRKTVIRDLFRADFSSGERWRWQC